MMDNLRREIRNVIKESFFPLSDPPMYGDSDYKKRGGKIFYKSPSDFLRLVPELKMDEETIENIEDLKIHMKSGKEIDPPTLYVDGDVVIDHDGRHRAYAAIELGFGEIPILVIDANNKVENFPVNKQG
jgi:hypothetical protein